MAQVANPVAMSSNFGGLLLTPTVQFRSKSRMLLCLRKDTNSNSFMGPPKSNLESHDIGYHEHSFSPSDSGVQINNTDIWKLFNDAQRNIIYLNKQRLAALEELKKVESEKQLLLERIKQLEETNQAGAAEDGSQRQEMCIPEAVESCSLSELLLRIDSMVVSDMIGTGEASDLRKMIMDNKGSINGVLFDIQQKNDLELLSELRQFSGRITLKALHVVHVCSEMEPIASFGPLASYVTGLSCALQRKGYTVEVILPKYTSIDLAPIKALRKIEAELDSYFGGHWHRNRLWTGIVNNIGVTLIEPLHHKAFFSRDRMYGYSDDFERFAYFSRASLDYLVKSGKQPDILHIHNWETAIIGPLFWDLFVHQGLGGTRILFTFHDLNSQCLESPDKLELCGLDPSRLHRADRLQDNIKKNLINILKGGIIYSNKVVFMSSIHSRERVIQSSGHGLEPTLAVHGDKLLIAPYGFDGAKYDPSKDKLLPAKYSAKNIEGKAVCKVALRHHLGFSRHSFAIVGCILSEVSDVDISNLRVAILHALGKGSQFIFMGAVMNTNLQLLQDIFKDDNVRFSDKYDEFLSHLILAGSDIILCSSYHDPLFQIPLKAIKYGSAPISFSTGQAVFGQTKGYDSGHKMFRHSEQQDFGSTALSQYILSTFANMSLGKALDEIKNEPTQWAWKIKDGMTRDFSWDAECCDVHMAAYESIKNL